MMLNFRILGQPVNSEGRSNSKLARETVVLQYRRIQLTDQIK